MDHSSLLLQIPQPSTPTYRNQIPQPSTPTSRNGVSSNSPMLRDKLSPQLHKFKPNPKRLSRSTTTLHCHNDSPKIFEYLDRVPIARDHSGNIPATPTTSKRAVTEEETEELSRGISQLHLKVRGAKQRRLNGSSTSTRGGSGLFGSLMRKPGRFKVRTINLAGTSKVEHK